MDTLRLLHELQVRRCELEAQDEALEIAYSTLQEDLTRFIELGERGPVGFFSIARDGTIERINLAGVGMLGLRSPRATGRRLRDYVSSASWPAYDAFLESLFARPGKQVCELELREVGNRRPVVVHVEGILDAPRSVCHLAAIDVSEQRKAQDALRESEALNVAVLDSLTEHICVLDACGTIVAVNAAWRQFAIENGAPELASGSLGVSYRAVCEVAAPQPSGRGALEAWAGIEAVLKGLRTSFAFEYPCHSADKSRYFRMNVYPLASPRGGAVIVHTNITASQEAADALRRARREAELANQAKSRFLAAASHDLRQPLAALGLYVDTLHQVLGPTDARLVQSIRDCVFSLRKLLSDLLDLSKLDAGVVSPEFSHFAVDDVVKRVISAQAPQAQLKKLALRHAASRVLVKSDPVLLERIIGNLVANAICYTERGGILIGCRRRQGRIWLEVWDTGIGIPTEMIDKIFEEFTRLDHGAAHGGSGLGLAIVARMATLLGLRLRVRSRLGRGSMFAIELPVGRPIEAGTARGVGENRSLRIALVDDNPQVLQALEYSLQAIGHKIVAAASGKDLLARLEAAAPDIVISDYRLAGGETGLDVVNRLRATFGSSLPAVLITGDTDPRVLRSMAGQAITVLHKPLELATLQHCIAELTARETLRVDRYRHGATLSRLRATGGDDKPAK